MASAEVEHTEKTPKRSLLPRRKRWRLALAFLVLLVGAGLLAWTLREDIADDFISAELAKLNLPATYEVAEIGPRRQVLTNLVIGDPDRPDFTIDRVTVNLNYGFRRPEIGLVEAQGARLFGTLKGGQLSFGALDSVIFAESDEPAGLPALDLKLIDARALIESDYGAIGVKAQGEGMLDDGFIGTIAATAPGLAVEGCSADSATLYGDLTTDAGSPAFAGPIRLRNLVCAASDTRLATADVVAEFALASDFASAQGDISLSASQIAAAGSQAERLNGEVQLSWRDDMVTVRHDLNAEGAVSPYGAIASLNADGTLRSRGNFARTEWDARIEGEGADLGGDLTEQLRTARDSAEGTLIAPLLAKFEAGLARAASGGLIAADVIVRTSPESTSLVMPEGRLRTASGETVLGLSRFAWSSSQNAPGRLSGNIETGGQDIPRITGRMERNDGGNLALRLRMEEYSAGDSRLAVPELRVTQSPAGALRFDGVVQASGALPGGAVQGLSVPLEGTWAPNAGLALGQRCTAVQFSELTLSQLRLNRRSVTICPKGGNALLRYDDALRISGSIDGLAVEGDLADTRLALRAGGIDISYPGAITANDIDVAVGEAAEPIRLSVETISANFDGAIGGQIEGGEVRFDFAASDPAAIYQIPFELIDLNASWSYADDRLQVDDASFALEDRFEEDRFFPLSARDAVLGLADNTITAAADLRHPASDRIVTALQLSHDLSAGTGTARLTLDGLAFDEALQPDDLTIYTKGFVSLVKGRVSGTGRIDWSGDAVTSRGIFSTEKVDFAAAFGPVKDARATVEFTDLLGLTTAPGQVVELGSINTGIEILDGRVRYSLVDGQLLKVEDARWPFMGGELMMRGVDLNFAEPEERRYTFEIINLDAGTFISQMEFGNLSATGKFNGTIPIVFDEQGNGRIESGLLISEAPGGNLSYIGDLTYEDLGTISNYAFNTLRSLDYRQMALTMDGSLTGEIITSIRFDGITQGDGADQNIISRQIAKLPIRFNINIRSQFWELSRLLRSTYDSAYLRDPCLTSDPKWRASRFFEIACEGKPNINPEDEPLGELPIQVQESENTP